VVGAGWSDTAEHRLPAGPGNVGRVDVVAISPDGELIAAGGWTTGVADQETIYLFDLANGRMVGRINSLPNVATNLTFSPDGRYLAAMLGGVNGLRVYDRYDGWLEVARDTEYGGSSYGGDFSVDGRLATTSYDGHVRLYDRSFHLIARERTAGGQQPFGIAFSPDGTKIAIGYSDSTSVGLLDSNTLAPVSSLGTERIDNGDLFSVAWSADGRTLFAGGTYDRGEFGHPVVVAWAQAGAGARRELPAGSSDRIMTLAPLANSDLLVAAADPYLAVLGADGGARWAQTRRQPDFRDRDRTLALSFDGQTVEFGYEVFGAARARFDLTTRVLQQDPPVDEKTAPPEHEALPIQDWKNTLSPTLDGAPLSLEPYETSSSLAIHPNASS
jgi:WD40 repeat protein